MADLKVVFAGGGTGGHRWPLVAVYDALKKQGKIKAWYFGTAADIESDEIRSCDWKTVTITSGKLRRYWSTKNLSDLFRVWRGWRLAAKSLAQIKPDAIFVKGGYVSVPVALAARKLRIPLITHESDTVLGLANRIIARLARTVAVSYPVETYGSKRLKKMVYTGPIIRQDLLQAKSAAQTRRVPRVLVLGGSQGAARINQLIWSSVETLVGAAQITHQTGQAGLVAASSVRQELPLKLHRRYQPVAFISNTRDLADELAWADVVVSRAGSTVFELALFGCPSVLIPLSTSAGDHQRRNAEYFERQGAAVVLDEDGLKAKDLSSVILRLLRSPKRRASLSSKISRLAVKDGAERLAKIIIQHAQS